jgi:hypothetical protein
MEPTAVPISPSEASQTLHEISATELESATAYRYARAAPHLILWGAIWVLGYGAGYLDSRLSILWIPLAIVGAVGSGRLGRRSGSPEQRGSWPRSIATAVAILVALASLFAVLGPLAGPRIGAFFPIAAGFAYTVIGIRERATRMIVLGVGLTALTVLGFFWVPQYFALWMAVVGGLGLIVGGVWLRTL